MNESVVIVDDSLTVRMDLAEAFETAGFSVLACATAVEARQALAHGPVGVVVLDVLLPDGDGIELLEEIRASDTNAASTVLMLSTESEVRDRIRGLSTGADEYVGKPYDTSYVIARARELLRRRHTEASAGRPTVLVIDDSVTFREELRQALEGAGYAVLVAASGEEGLRLAADERPNAMVVDGVMPGIAGATVIRRVRLDAALRGVPCVLLTASEDRDAELSALEAGADAFVRKDEAVEVVLARLAAILRSAATPQRDETTSSLGPKKILAVDDSPTYLHELAATLRADGYDVVLARSGQEALELLAVQPVDCILLDLLMPGLSGRETCRRIKSTPLMRDIPLIMLTALEDRTAMVDVLGVGADDYIQKSSELEVLKARLRAQIRRKQFEDENRRIREELLRHELATAQAEASRVLAETRATLLDELERKNKELEAFSYSVSHDLRAPLRSIDGFSQALLEDYADRLDARGQDYLRRVRAAAQRMAELIDDLLQLSRVGRSELRRDRVDLAQLARSVLAELQSHEPERTVEARIQDRLPVEVDARLMKIVLDNLLGNAWKFTSHTQSPMIELGVDELATGPAYFIRDNGVGFDMKYADKLFGVFQRLHKQEEFPGTGIGLATVQRIIDRHGGRVWAESEPGAGAKFSFTLNAVKGS